MGVDDPKKPGDNLLRVRNRVIVAVLFFALYAVTFGSRGSLLAALVSGALGAVVIFLLLGQVDERRRRR